MHGGAIHDSEAASFHFGIVRRRGNGTRYKKDASSLDLGWREDPKWRQDVYDSFEFLR